MLPHVLPVLFTSLTLVRREPQTFHLSVCFLGTNRSLSYTLEAR